MLHAFKLNYFPCVKSAFNDFWSKNYCEKTNIALALENKMHNYKISILFPMFLITLFLGLTMLRSKGNTDFRMATFYMLNLFRIEWTPFTKRLFFSSSIAGLEKLLIIKDPRQIMERSVINSTSKYPVPLQHS